MAEPAQPLQTIDDYIERYPPQIQEILQQVRAAIREAAPQAVEKIAYQMPTFFLKGNLVHFAVYSHHLGFYPTPSGIAAFQEELKPYKRSKGAVQFPLEQPMPLDLIRRITAYRVSENLAKK